ncbi:hypothetical protein BBM62_02155 [Vibrio parahaemolyticus]|uniref:restriction endonuclease subunit S n=1 Tax=Vibrio parahaemolyticus TaxID=670 RepID=UPI00084A7840|nr:restriction endonuclease subunit S [Vibrio parahaemolyticus]OEA50313.1 hypothetical protein BBM62_02155 [Vibrio parahaemolyticus]
MSWPLVKLGDLFKVTSGGTPSRKKSEYYDGGDIHWVKTGDLHNKYVRSASEFITQEGLDGSSARLYPKGTVLVAMYGATIGACSILDIEAATNQACAAFTPSEKVDPVFLYYLLKHSKPAFVKAGSGGAQPNISGTFLKNFEIPLPPLDEQKRIAAILDKADAIRQKRKQAIDLADEFLRSVFLDMFGDVSGVGESTVEKLAEDRKGSMRTGPFGSQLLHSEFTESGVSVLGIDNAVKNRFEWGKERFISQDKYSELSRYTVLPGDVLITIMGTCGRCAVVPEGIPVAINTKHLCCITLDKSKCLPEFLHSYFLYHPIARRYLEKNTKGAIMAGLNMGIIKAMPVPVFPLAMQNKYVEIAKKIESSRYNREESETLGNRSFDSVSQKVFSGQL